MKRRRWGLLAATLIGVTPLVACAPEVPTALFLGDSYTAGVELPADDIADRWASRLSAHQGWVERNEGCAGAGYTHPGQICMTTYRERIDALADANPDVIVVSGAVNDLGATLGEIEAAAQATFVTLQRTFPNARIYAIGGVYADGGGVGGVGRAGGVGDGVSTSARLADGATGADGPTLQEIDTIIAAQARAAGATFVDIGAPLQDRPDLMTADGLHPNSAGHAVIAELTANVIGEID